MWHNYFCNGIERDIAFFHTSTVSKFKILVPSQPQSLHVHQGPKVRFLPVASHSLFYDLYYSAQFEMTSSLSTAVLIASCFRMVYTDGSVDRPTRSTSVNYVRSLTASQL